MFSTPKTFRAAYQRTIAIRTPEFRLCLPESAAFLHWPATMGHWTISWLLKPSMPTSIWPKPRWNRIIWCAFAAWTLKKLWPVGENQPHQLILRLPQERKNGLCFLPSLIKLRGGAFRKFTGNFFLCCFPWQRTVACNWFSNCTLLRVSGATVIC